MLGQFSSSFVSEWWGAGMVICLERVADLHTAQLIPLPLTVSCFSKIQIGFTFLGGLTRVVPEKGPLNGCVCVCDSKVFCAFLDASKAFDKHNNHLTAVCLGQPG